MQTVILPNRVSTANKLMNHSDTDARRRGTILGASTAVAAWYLLFGHPLALCGAWNRSSIYHICLICLLFSTSLLRFGISALFRHHRYEAEICDFWTICISEICLKRAIYHTRVKELTMICWLASLQLSYNLTALYAYKLVGPLCRIGSLANANISVCASPATTLRKLPFIA